MTISAKIRKRLHLLLKIIVVGMVYLFLFFELSKPEHQIWHHFLSATEQIKPYYLWMAVALMPFNWLTESIKWRFLVKRIENVSIKDAFQAVLAGTSISIFTPNRIGDYLGRIFILKKGDRWDGTIATVVGNISQLLITLLMGSIAIFYYSSSFNDAFFQWNSFFVWLFRFIIILVDFSLLYIYFKSPVIEKQLSKHFDLKRYPLLKHLNLMAEYKISDLAKVLIYSFARYLIYSIQFYLIFVSFDLSLGLLQGFLAVFLIFFVMTIIPSIAIAELGIRGLITIFVFGVISTDLFQQESFESILVSASSLLWFINLAIPAFIGGLFIFNLRFFRKKEKL